MEPEPGAANNPSTLNCNYTTILYWMDNIQTRTGLSVEDSIRMTEDRDKCRKYVHGVSNPRIEDG